MRRSRTARATGLNLIDANSGSSPGYPASLTVLGDQWLFRATDTNLGREFFITDGTPDGTSLLMDINPGASDGSPYPIGIADDVLYFYAADGSNGSELWATDGTANGTRLVYDINPGSDSSYPRDFVAVPGGFVFDAAVEAAMRCGLLMAGNTERDREGGGDSFPTVSAYGADFPLIGNTLIVNTGGLPRRASGACPLVSECRSPPTVPAAISCSTISSLTLVRASSSGGVVRRVLLHWLEHRCRRQRNHRPGRKRDAHRQPLALCAMGD